jgi:hypothetical protein
MQDPQDKDGYKMLVSWFLEMWVQGIFGFTVKSTFHDSLIFLILN